MLATAYEDGRLGPRYGNDKLSIIPLGGAPGEYEAFDIDASNSVAGPPAVVDITPDGQYAFVIETWTPRPGESDEETFSDLKHGNKLTVINLSDPTNPVQHDQIEIQERPDSVSVSHDGRYLAIAYHNQGAGEETPIGVYRIRDGKVIAQHYPEVPGFDLSKRIISAKWHPQKNILALINEPDATVRFVELQESSNTVSFRSWGNEISIGKAPFIGRFTEDGKHFLVNNLFWGSDVQNQWSEAPRGTIANITLENFVRDGEPVHSITSQVLVGPSPEGFAVSPDGRYVAAVNMERSWLTYDDDRQTWFSSISLIERNPDTGEMTYLHTTPYYAVLPEMAVFDASSQYLAVVAYDQYDRNEAGGSVDFFKIVLDPLDRNRKMLVQTRYSVPVQHGAHDMVLVD